MGSIGANKLQIVTEEIKDTPLIFGTAMIRPATKEMDSTVDIDGYSNKKTLKGALNDLVKAIAKYNKDEADALKKGIKNNEFEQINTVPDGGGYILEYEEVPSAVQYNEDGEPEYKEAKWYLHTRFVK